MPLAARDIQEIYLAYFGRPADPTGLAYWQGKANLTETANAFAQSAEYQSLYAANDYTQLVTNIYQNLFKRAPEETGLKYWVQQLNDGKVQPGQAALTILGSALGQDAAVLKAKLDTAESFTAALGTETLAAAYKGAGPAADARANWAAITSEATAATIKANFPALIDKMQAYWVDGVQKVYVAYLGRPADSGGLNYWVERAIATNGDWNSIAEGFASSAESQKLYGTSSNAALVNAIYLNVLGRAAEPAGSQYWIDQLTKGATTPGALALTLANSTLGKDTTTLNQRIDGAKAFTLQLETAGRNDDFTGATVTSVAREWLYGIGPEQNDYDAAIAAIPYLVSAFVKGQVQGLLVNGYISGATVFIDADGDGVLDAGEVSVKSDAAGNFLFPEGTEKGTVVAFGGTNISTGQANTTTLKAPVGATVVTPLTNLVQKMIDSGLADGIDAAENLLFGALGVPKVDLSAFDPLRAALNGSAAEKAIAIQIEAATVQIANTLATGSALLQGTGLAPAQAQAAMLGALTQSISGGTSVNLGQASTLQTVLEQAVSNSGLTPTQQTQANNAIGATSQVLGEINTRTEQAADAFGAGTITNPVSALSDMFKLATLVQTEVTGAVQQGTSSGNTTQLTTDYTGTGLTQNVDQVQGGQITPGTPTDDGTTVTNGGGVPPVVPPVEPPAPDTIAPVFTSAATNADGTKVILTYDEVLSATTAAVGAFNVPDNTVTAVNVVGSTVVLTLATPVTNGQTVTVGYTDPTLINDANAIQDAAGNDAATLAKYAIVTNNVPNAAPTIAGVPTEPAAVTVGVVFDLADFTVADTDNDNLTVTLTANNGTIAGLTDTDQFTPGIQLTGSAATINTALAGATFTATSAGSASVGISVTDGKVAQPVTGTYSLTASAANAAPTIAGVPTEPAAVTVGVVFDLADFTVADTDNDNLTVTLTANNGTIAGLTDTDQFTPGIQLTGSAATINTALAGATFTATSAGSASVGISVTDGKVAVIGTYSLIASDDLG